jgi:hypothetical protein
MYSSVMVKDTWWNQNLTEGTLTLVRKQSRYISSFQRARLLLDLHFLQRATCANHKAVNQANSNRKNLEATGVGACACARHGCFVPHSVVDFQKGERYTFVELFE